MVPLNEPGWSISTPIAPVLEPRIVDQDVGRGAVEREGGVADRVRELDVDVADARAGGAEAERGARYAPVAVRVVAVVPAPVSVSAPPPAAAANGPA